MTRKSRARAAKERCSGCLGTAFVDAIDNHGQPYRGCARCIVGAVPEICRFVDGDGAFVELHELDYPFETVTLVRTSGVAEVYKRHQLAVTRGAMTYCEAEYRLVHVRYPNEETEHAAP